MKEVSLDEEVKGVKQEEEVDEWENNVSRR